MNSKLYEHFSRITEEEQAILDGNTEIQKQIYTNEKDFVIDSRKMLKRGKLIDVRHHTRFVYFPKHRHNFIEIIYMYQGTTTHILDNGEKVVLEQGDLLLLNQNAEHEILPAGVNDIAINFLVQPEFFDIAFNMMEDESLLRDFLIDTLTTGSDRSMYLYFKARDELTVQNLMENMMWVNIHDQENRRNINQFTMGLLFLHLVNLNDKIHYGSSHPYEQKSIARILSYIETSYRTATLEELCLEFHQTPSQLSKFIKRMTGHTFKELLQKKRLNQAAFLLSTTKLAVGDIILAVGYDNNSYFYRVFQSRFGITPKEYREENKNIK